MPRPVLRYTPPSRPDIDIAAGSAGHAPPTTTTASTAAPPAASAELPLSLPHVPPLHHPSQRRPPRRPPRRRRDDLSDDDDDQADAINTIHIRKWIRTATTTDAPTLALGTSSSLPATWPESPIDPPDTTIPPAAGAAPPDAEMPDAPSQPTYFCSAPNCPLPPTTTFRSLSAVESHILKNHHHICRSSRAHSRGGARCNTVFPSNHLLDIHLQEAHSPLFWAQVARGDTGLYGCFSLGCLVKADGMRERRKHMVAVHGWGADKVEHVQRQVARGASKYLQQEEEEEGIAADDGGGMKVDEVVGAFMELNTSGAAKDADA